MLNASELSGLQAVTLLRWVRWRCDGWGTQRVQGELLFLLQMP